MVEFPPPSSGGGAAGVEPAYPSAPERPGFVFPPPRQSSGSVRDAGRYVGEKLRDATDLAEWSAETSRNQGQVLVDYGSAIEDLGKNRVMPWAVPTVAPLSQSINRRADPTFQLSDLMSPLMRGRSDAAGHNHQHDTTSVPWQMQRGMNTKGRIYYAFITPAVTRAYTQLNFMVSEVTDPCRMDIAVYVVDPNRGLTRQVHQTDAAATLGFGESVFTVNFPTFVADQGSYLAIAFLQHGTGNSRYILGLDDTPRPLLGSIFPPKISATNQQTGRTALPAFIDGNNGNLVDFAGYWFTPYAELSEDVGIDYKMFTEAWGHGSVAPRPWVTIGPGGIYSESMGYAAPRGDGLRVSMYDTPLTTDHVRVRTTIPHLSSGGTRRSTLVFRGTNDLRTGLGLSAINDTRYEIIRWANLAVDSDEDWDNRTVVATINRAPTVGDRLEVDYLDGQVIVRINDVERYNGTIAGYSGTAYRFLGIQMRRAQFITSTTSPRFGPWSACDLPQESGGDDGEDAA
ncbi:hypothetical protein NCCP2495_05320 [Dietzia sp. NCCP-2495]|uniref:hypothetical protein n=1 Tax=Dietzia sp. NCCP-2495 TaxID=2934675 RepID=UPI00223154EE|nr:hypothetical protein [Dietzia sp. NCCP-2495]GLB62654.1 hypothetical protein NCCP2495_05320 [Dietzia sp. NCCP-2495]